MRILANQIIPQTSKPHPKTLQYANVLPIYFSHITNMVITQQPRTDIQVSIIRFMQFDHSFNHSRVTISPSNLIITYNMFLKYDLFRIQGIKA